MKSRYFKNEFPKSFDLWAMFHGLSPDMEEYALAAAEYVYDLAQGRLVEAVDIYQDFYMNLRQQWGEKKLIKFCESGAIYGCWIKRANPDGTLSLEEW